MTRVIHANEDRAKRDLPELGKPLYLSFFEIVVMYAGSVLKRLRNAGQNFRTSPYLQIGLGSGSVAWRLGSGLETGSGLRPR